MRRTSVYFVTLLLCLGALSVPFMVQAAPTLDDQYGFRSFWEAHNGAVLFGNPITEPFEENGRTVQYFTNVRFEYVPEAAQFVQLGLVGRERSQWQTFAPQPNVSGAKLTFEASDYVVRGPYRSFWEANGGLEIFGLPISAPLWERLEHGRFQVQYFERAKMIYHPLHAGKPNEIQLAPLGKELAAARGYIAGKPSSVGQTLYEFIPQAPIPTATPVPPTPSPKPTNVPVVATQAPAAPAATTAPVSQPAPSAAKSITISISQQWLYAYEGETLVYDAPITTGKDGFNTPLGNFAVYAKIPLQTMRGSLGGESWVVPNVPHAMYFTGGVALHGTYWHDLFGSGVRISHGCVNLPLWAAEWMYNWAPVGTPVSVIY